MYEFFCSRQFQTANISDIKRFRIVPGDGGHGYAVVCAVLKDGRVGRFLEEEVAPLVELKDRYQSADSEYQLGYAAYLSGSKTTSEIKSLERAKRQAFQGYAKAKKAAMRF